MDTVLYCGLQQLRVIIEDQPSYFKNIHTLSGLVMVQTTNGIFNKTLYDLSTPKALLAWHRVRLANWLASSGEEWANYVSQYNSGMHI